MQDDNRPQDVPALAIRALDKRYGARPVLDAIDLDVAPGAAFGLVGANGAGKTTLIKCALDLCAPNAGSIAIFGVPHALPRARARLTFIPERFVPPHYLTGREFVALMLSLNDAGYESGRVAQLLEDLELDASALERPVGQLSKGMTQKLGLLGCFLTKRDLYVLDEPMSGLDPSGRVAVKSVLGRLTREGRTLFFTSHVLSDVEELCSMIAVLAGGIICFHGTPGELCERYSEPQLERAFIQCTRDNDRTSAIRL
ncbi:MAG: ABC transporter ATP-binding protein [Betaproteobacteria bacterium]|nr:ABC transporter ATP-binding protein [Betaproteobacteria bacterium]